MIVSIKKGPHTALCVALAAASRHSYRKTRKVALEGYDQLRITTTTTFDVWKKLVVISQSLFGINGSIVAISLPYCCSRWRLWETIGATALPSPQQQLRNEERATKIDRQQTAGSKSVAEELEIASADSKKCSLVGRDHLVSIRDIWVFVLSSVKLRRISFRKWPYKERGPREASD